MDGHKPGAISPGRSPAPTAPTSAPVPVRAPEVPAKPAAPSSIQRSQMPAQLLRPAVKAPAASQSGTVFNARMAQFGRAAAPAPLPDAGAYKSVNAIRMKHDELSEKALGLKGIEPGMVSTILDFMEAVARSGANFYDEKQRAALSQILVFWTRKVTPAMEKGPNMQLAEYAGA